MNKLSLSKNNIAEKLAKVGLRTEQSPFEPVFTFVDLSIIVFGDE